jgi:hypothetical protein
LVAPVTGGQTASLINRVAPAQPRKASRDLSPRPARRRSPDLVLAPVNHRYAAKRFDVASPAPP